MFNRHITEGDCYYDLQNKIGAMITNPILHIQFCSH